MDSAASQRKVGRPPRISRETVVAHALALTPVRGLDALTIGSVAEGLGVKPMALYRHVRSKQDLLEAVTQAALAEIELPPTGEDPLEDVAELVRRIRAVLVRYPGIAGHVLAAGGPPGEDGLRMIDWSMACLLRAGLHPAEAGRAHVLLFRTVVGLVRLDDDDGQTPEQLEHHHQTELKRVQGLDPDAFPALAAVAPTLAETDAEGHFEYGLDRLLDGLRSRLASDGQEA